MAAPISRGSARSPSSSPRGSFDSNLSSSSTLCSAKSNDTPPTSPTSAAATATSPSNMYSNTSTRSRRLTPPQTLLGAIDEHSPRVQPDLSLASPQRDHPVAKLHVYTAMSRAKQKQTLACSAGPPEDAFNMVVGPNGERFADLRLNRKVEAVGGWKKLMCFR